MRSIHRPCHGPACLLRYDWKKDQWGGNPKKPNDEERLEIWVMLEAMQRSCCAYCEATLKPDRHIDHFVPRSYMGHTMGKEQTFLWSNLFGSCGYFDCCGHFKDNSKNPHSKYDPSQLIKPDVDDPWQFFVFAVDGYVSPKEGLSAAMHQRALLTIDVFSLNHPRHVACRKNWFAYFCNQYKDLFSLAGLDDADSGDQTDEIWSLLGAEIEMQLKQTLDSIPEYRSTSEQWMRQLLPICVLSE